MKTATNSKVIRLVIITPHTVLSTALQHMKIKQRSIFEILYFTVQNVGTLSFTYSTTSISIF
jgi:hypothetical protein